MFRTAVSFFLMSVSSAALAADVPRFLQGKVYSTNASQCGDTVNANPDTLQLSKEGIYGEEYSCQFLEFKTESDPSSGRIYSVVAIATCSDDSGITRPDLISMSPYEEGGQVIVQSQNEYIKGEMELMIAQQPGKDFPEKNSHAWVSDTYNICK